MIDPVANFNVAPEFSQTTRTKLAIADVSPIVPKPFPMTFPRLSAGAEALAKARRTLLEAEATVFYAHVKECAACVVKGLTEDINSGVLPTPQHDPKTVEDELYNRATLQTRNSEYMRYYSDAPLVTLLLAATVPSYTSMFNATEQNYSEAMGLHVRGGGREGVAVTAVVLSADVPHPCVALGLNVAVNWMTIGVIVLRNQILTAIWADSDSRAALMLNRRYGEGNRRSPIWVGEPPVITPVPVAQGRRRKRS